MITSGGRAQRSAAMPSSATARLSRWSSRHYFTLIALTPRAVWMPDVRWAQLLPLSVLYLALGIWGFDFARRRAPADLAGLPAGRVRDRHAHQRARVGRRAAADSAAARGAGRRPAAAPARRRDVPPRHRRRQRQSVVGARWPHWLRNIAAGHRRRRVRGRLRRGRATRARGAAARRSARRPKSRSSPPRTSATAWRGRFTTRSGTI